MDQDQQMLSMQAQINTLQEQLNLASQAVAQANQAYQNLSVNSPNLKHGSPDKFTGSNSRSWLKSIYNIFEAQNGMVTDDQKIKYAVSYMAGDGLQWWELSTIHGRNIMNYEHFKQELLKYFENINREINARRNLNALKQMGRFASVRAYNHEFSKWLLQVPSMTPAEQIFHSSQGLKNRTRNEVERAEPQSLQDAMRIADRIDSLYQNTYGAGNFGFGNNSNNGFSDGPTPMQIGNINYQRSNRLSELEKRRCIENNLCCICKKENRYARKHKRNNSFQPRAGNNNGNNYQKN